MENTENVENLQRAQMIAYKEILSFKEALIYLDVSESFLYKLTHKKAIEFTKPNGGKIYFRKSDLDNWMLQSISESKRVLEEDVFNHLKRNGNGKKIN
ncbi:helix-turn-helix domain-containing protein [Winogradskyella sp. F6397]|uniref:Helix-turn-helix domain-containing protein n=1 Tax=Winogradskyella marina TaxID=2785530 RepID=A0ABS0EF30_9FLAO|nr:helix-turn-helix domain-containing protein [Winogradskyella marina]MBF8149062.1 helix-turn-helix domain-containing protein [Winogradskyella marina]